jgi:hypothetical protein
MRFNATDSLRGENPDANDAASEPQNCSFAAYLLLGLADVFRLQTFRALLDVELHVIALVK